MKAGELLASGMLLLAGGLLLVTMFDTYLTTAFAPVVRALGG